MKPFTGQTPVFDNINSKAKILENVTIHIHKHGYGLSLGRDRRDQNVCPSFWMGSSATQDLPSLLEQELHPWKRNFRYHMIKNNPVNIISEYHCDNFCCYFNTFYSLTENGKPWVQKSIKSKHSWKCKVKSAKTHRFILFWNSQRNLVMARLLDIPSEASDFQFAYIITMLLNTSLHSKCKFNPIWNGSQGRPFQQQRTQAGTVVLQFAVFRSDRRHLNGLHLNAAAAAPTSAVPRWHAGYIRSFLLLWCKEYPT